METSIVSAVCIGRNCLLGNGKKIAKFLMRTFTCRSTFLYGVQPWCYTTQRKESGSGEGGQVDISVLVGRAGGRENRACMR